jgi:putative ABC transport system permease protein
MFGDREIETLGQDGHFGFRILRKNPGITAAIVLTLALGIGANTAIFSQFRIDELVLGFTLVASLLTGVIFGLAPAIHASKSKLTEGLKEGRSVTKGSRHHRLLNLLVVSELGLSLVLLVGAGLMLKSLFLLQRAQLGFDPRNLLTMSLFLNPSKYSESQREGFFQQVIERIKGSPGVRSICLTIPAPLPGPGRPTNFIIDGQPEPTAAEMPRALNCYADSIFFATLGIPLLRGRVFTEADMRKRNPEAVIISASMARRFWPNGESLGKRIKIIGRGTSAQWMSVVGVVGDIRHDLAAEGGPTMYRPLGSSPVLACLVIRVTPDKLSLAPALRRAVQEVNKELPVPGVLSVDEIISQSLWESRFILSLVGVFAVVALLLATIGVYGVMSYRVSERRHEIGIRMALGAQSGDLIKLLMGQGLKLVFAGVGMGLVVALGVTRFIRSLLSGVTPTDPVTFAWVSLSLAGVALVAIYFSSRKVTRVDPMVALRLPL